MKVKISILKCSKKKTECVHEGERGREREREKERKREREIDNDISTLQY